MQTGSLATPKQDIEGTFMVRGQWARVCRDLIKGEVLTISGILYNQQQKCYGLTFEELGVIIHPSTGSECSLWDEMFDELQPPISIADELFSHAPEKCEA